MVYKMLKNPVGEKWDFATSQRIEYYIDFEITGLTNMVGINKALEVLGKIISYPVTGSLLYDIVAEFFEDKPKKKIIKDLIHKFVTTIGMYDAVIEFRQMLVSKIFGADVLSRMMRVFSLILTAYNLGRLEAMYSEKSSVIVSNIVGPLELHLLIILEVTSRKSIMGRVNSIEPIYGTDRKRYEKFLRTQVIYDLKENIAELDDKQLIAYANQVRNSMDYSYCNHMYHEYNEDFKPHYDLLESSAWEREDTNSSDSDMIAIFKAIIEINLDRDVLKHRKVFIREKGVHITFHNPMHGFSSMVVREFHSAADVPYEEHYIELYYSLEGDKGSRMLVIDMQDIQSVTIPLMYETDAEATLFLLAWLGLINPLNSDYESVKEKIYNHDFGEPVEDKILNNFSQSISRIMKHAVDTMNPDNYSYLTPIQWNYNFGGTGKIQGVPKQNRGQSKIVKVGRYSRKLPVGQNPSVEALQLARRVLIDLKPGYTLVDEHEKMVRGKAVQ